MVLRLLRYGTPPYEDTWLGFGNRCLNMKYIGIVGNDELTWVSAL